MIDIIKENKKHLGGPSQYSMNEMHEHHIVPKYHCKKINVSYDFAENIVNAIGWDFEKKATLDEFF